MLCVATVIHFHCCVMHCRIMYQFIHSVENTWSCLQFWAITSNVAVLFLYTWILAHLKVHFLRIDNILDYWIMLTCFSKLTVLPPYSLQQCLIVLVALQLHQSLVQLDVLIFGSLMVLQQYLLVVFTCIFLMTTFCLLASWIACFWSACSSLLLIFLIFYLFLIDL